MDMRAQSAASRFVELDSIRADTSFYLDLMLQLSTHKSSAVLIFEIVPFLSLLTIEAYDYLQREFPVYAADLLKTHEKIIRRSRMRTKFFDDRVKRIDGMLDLLAWIVQFHRDWHINQHKGFLAPLKKALQCDLGIFVYDGHVIGSTHTGLLNLGLEEGDLPTGSEEIPAILGSLSRSVSEDIGRYVAYVAQLSAWREFAPTGPDVGSFVYSLEDEKFGYRDERSTSYFASVFNGPGTEAFNISLLLFLVTVNFLEHILKCLWTGSPTTLFKLKFVTLYHLYSSIEKLKNFYYPSGMLTDRSKEYAQAILGDRGLQSIKRQSAFRNILVHYRIDGVPESSLTPTTKLYGLVEHFFDGQTYADVDKKLDDQVARVSLLLEEWLNWTLRASQISKWDFSEEQLRPNHAL